MAIPSGLYRPENITIIGIDPQGNGTILPTAPVNSGGFIIFNFDDPQSSLYHTFGMALLQTPKAQIIDYGGGGGSDSPGSAIGGEQLGENVAPVQENAPVQELLPHSNRE